MLRFKTITRGDDCKAVWNKFTPKKTLWDEWEYCACFFDSSSEELRFIVGFEKKKPVGLLPLQYWRSEETYCFFGGTFPEQRTFFMDKKFIKNFLRKCPKNCYLEDISSVENEFHEFVKGSYRYFLIPKKYNFDFDTYLSSFSKKHRKNMRYDLRQLQKCSPVIKRNSVQDFDRLIALNIDQFGKKSNFVDDESIVGLRNVMHTAKKRNELCMVSVVIDGVVEAVDIAVMYNGVYHVLATGRNKNIKNLGKLLITEHIKEGMNKKVKEVDFMTSAGRWKRLWNFDRERLVDFGKWEW